MSKRQTRCFFATRKQNRTADRCTADRCMARGLPAHDRNPATAFVARFLGNPPMNLLPAIVEPAGDHVRGRLAGATYELPHWPIAALRSHINQQVTFGIRPEDLYEDPVTPMPRLPVQVRAIEPLGAETILLLSAGGQNHELAARVGRETSFRIGESRDISFDVAAVHIRRGHRQGYFSANHLIDRLPSPGLPTWQPPRDDGFRFGLRCCRERRSWRIAAGGSGVYGTEQRADA
jgi:MalK OB fold domain